MTRWLPILKMAVARTATFLSAPTAFTRGRGERSCQGGRSLNLSASWVLEGRYPAMMCQRCRKPTQKISTLCSDPKAFFGYLRRECRRSHVVVKSATRTTLQFRGAQFAVITGSEDADARPLRHLLRANPEPDRTHRGGHCAQCVRRSVIAALA